jgi:hypothetical protein
LRTHSQPITCHKIPKTTQIVPYKPQTYENHTNRFQTLATAYPQGLRQLLKARPFRNHQGVVRQLDPARSHPPSQKRLTMEWIKCSERLPEPGEPVLIFTTDRNQAYAWLGNGRWYYEHQMWLLIEVSHWMPLPPNPF